MNTINPVTGPTVAGESELPSLLQLLDLTGKVAIVTGGGRGIGEAIARRLSEAGANVEIADLSTEDPVDVTDPSSVVRFAEAVRNRHNSLDILVNNAGVFPRVPLAELDPETLDRILRINVHGVMNCTRACVPLMQASGGGVVVNVSSTAGVRAQTAAMTGYVASKHAVDGITKAAALELGPLGIRVMGVAPSFVLTPGTAEIMGTGSEVAGHLDHLAAVTPLQRVGAPDDVARAVVFCASGLAEYMTGSTLLVDGGAMTL